MDWIGLAITIAAVLALLVGIGWLLIFGRRDEWPEGTRREAPFRGHNAAVAWGEGTTPTRAGTPAVATAQARGTASAASTSGTRSVNRRSGP